MTHVTEDDLDNLEFDTLRTGDHVGTAKRLIELAETVSSGVSRANVLLRAGEQWQHAGDHAEAAEVYQRAIDDGGDAYGDPRIYLAGALFELNHAERAHRLLGQVRADTPGDPEVYRSAAELLYEQGDLAGAHDWATEGADRAKSADPDGLEGLLRIRYRCRLDLKRPEDEYDAMLDDLLKKDAPDRNGQVR